MGFASPLLLALLGLSSVDGFWFGGMQEPDVMGRGLERRQLTMECGAGSTDCGLAGCISTAACCNAAADWSCLEGNACYTVDGTVDCYTTTIPVPTVSRACFDYTQTGCRGGLTCFQCRTSSYGHCVTTVLFGGSETWLNCFTSSTIKTINVSPAPRTSDSSSSGRVITTGPTTTRPTGSSRLSATTSPPFFTESPAPEKGGLGGGAIAGIVIGSFAVLTIAAVSLFLLFRKKPAVQQTPHVAHPPPPPPPQSTYTGYQQPPYQGDQVYSPGPQPPYSPPPQQYYGAPGMQQAGYPGPSPASPGYSDPTKEQPQTSPPVELSTQRY